MGQTIIVNRPAMAPLEDGMKKLQIKIKKGSPIGIDEIAIIEGRIMSACVQFYGYEEQEPEDFTYLTAKENIEIIIKNWKG